MAFHSTPNLQGPNQNLPNIPPHNLFQIPGQADPDPQDALVPIPGQVNLGQQDVPAPNPGQANPIPQNAPAWRSEPNLAAPIQIRSIRLPPPPPYSSLNNLPGQVDPDPRDVPAPNPGQADPIPQNAPAWRSEPNLAAPIQIRSIRLPPPPSYSSLDNLPGQVDPDPRDVLAPNQGVAGPIRQNAPAPNPHEAGQILQNAPAQNQDEANQANATSGLSMVWTYFIDNLTHFWPPIPSRIASNVAFCPPSPSYSIEPINGRNTLRLNQNVPNQLNPAQLSRIEVFKTISNNQNEIVCMFIPFQNARFTLFISHGHDVDIGQRCSFYYRLGIRMRCNVFAYDYSGYGCSNGIPSEANMYADAHAALEVLTSINGITVEQIIFYGHTLGTAAAIHLARQERHWGAGGLILIAPFKSGLRVLFPKMRFTCCFDCFRNIDMIRRVWCLTLIIEPRDDVLFGRDTDHAVALHARARRTHLEVTSIEGRRYDDVEESEPCLARMYKFITEEAVHQPPPAAWVLDHTLHLCTLM